MKNQNQVQIYKFGGASVKEASSIRQVGQIVSQSDSPQLLIVVSAMGKTTNKLESIINHCFRTGEVKLDEVQSLKKEHEDIVKALDLDLSLDTFFDEFKHCCLSTPKTHFSYYYDQCIGFGELVSSTILASYLDKSLGNTAFLDVRNLIFTNDKHQNAEVDWEETKAAVLSQNWDKKILVTQGFIAQSKSGKRTTLGREGSDFSAAILASILNAKKLTIWKDVDGFFNADPRRFPDAIQYQTLPYREAIELAYYGASVVHPKTIQPLQKHNIDLYVRSFLNPERPGTKISEHTDLKPNVSSIIVKDKLFLLSLSTKDLSFIVEKQLQDIFGICSQQGVRVMLIQNSATSCDLVLQNDDIKMPLLLSEMNSKFRTKHNSNVKLYTIRSYNQKLIDDVLKKGRFILEERNNKTVQILIQET